MTAHSSTSSLHQNAPSAGISSTAVARAASIRMRRSREVTFESTTKGTQLRKASDKECRCWGRGRRLARCILDYMAVRYSAECSGLAPEGGRLEDAQAWQASVSWHLARRQAWQADKDDKCRQRRFDQAQVENSHSTLKKGHFRVTWLERL